MTKEDGIPLDRLAHEHERISYDPDGGERTQVVAVENDGRTLEVIVPLLRDDARVGEVVAAAVSGETVFLLGRLDRPLDDHRETSGLLVVAVPHRDGRHRAAIVHATYSPGGLGLYPAPGAGTGTVPTQAGNEAGDARSTQADFRRLEARLFRVDADAHGVSLDLRREIQEVDLNLGRAIHRGTLDLRDEFQRGLREHIGELVSLRFTSNFHGWLLRFLVIALICALFPAIWWSGTMDSRAHQHDLLLERIEEDSIKRREAADLRLDGLEAAIRGARERTAPAR